MSKLKEFPLASDIWGMVKWQISKTSHDNRTFEYISCFSLFQRLLNQFQLFKDWICEKLILFINSFYHVRYNYHTVFNKTWRDCNACGSGAISEVGRLKNATCKSCIYYIRSVTVVPVLHCHVHKHLILGRQKLSHKKEKVGRHLPFGNWAYSNRPHEEENVDLFCYFMLLLFPPF